MHICFPWKHPRSRRCGSTLHNAERLNTPTCRSDCLKAVCRVWTFIDTYFNPAMRNKATRRRRSIPQAFGRDTQTWHHGVLAESPLARWTVAIPQASRSRHQSYHGTSKPAIPNANAGFRKHQLETQVASQSQHINSSHSPCRRSIPQALVRDTHTWHHCVLPEDPLACLMDAIPQARVRDTPVASRHNVDAGFRKHQLESQVASHSQHIKSSHSHVDAQFHKHSFETHIHGIIAFERNPLLHAGSMRSSHPLVLKLGYLNPS